MHRIGASPAQKNTSYKWAAVDKRILIDFYTHFVKVMMRDLECKY